MPETVQLIFILIFSIPIIGIIMGVAQKMLRDFLEHKQRIAEIKARAKAPQAISPEALEALRTEVHELRDRLNMMAIDNDRLATLTRETLVRSQASPPPPPAQAYTQRIES